MRSQDKHKRQFNERAINLGANNTLVPTYFEIRQQPII